MKLSKTVFLVLLIETIVAFLFCIGIGFIFHEEPDWNLTNVSVYKTQTGLLIFFNFLPALFIPRTQTLLQEF